MAWGEEGLVCSSALCWVDVSRGAGRGSRKLGSQLVAALPRSLGVFRSASIKFGAPFHRLHQPCVHPLERCAPCSILRVPARKHRVPLTNGPHPVRMAGAYGAGGGSNGGVAPRLLRAPRQAS
ncbi:hypothetical protein MTO96_000886 [Rhipicephalus appendiculatus]